MSEERKYPFEDKELARKAGRKGGKAAQAKLRKAGISADKLGDLDTYDDAKRWLGMIGRAVIGGTLDKGDAKAGISAVEAWLKAEADRLSAATVKDLEGRLEELEAQMRRQQMGAS